MGWTELCLIPLSSSVGENYFPTKMYACLWNGSQHRMFSSIILSISTGQEMFLILQFILSQAVGKLSRTEILGINHSLIQNMNFSWFICSVQCTYRCRRFILHVNLCVWEVCWGLEGRVFLKQNFACFSFFLRLACLHNRHGLKQLLKNAKYLVSCAVFWESVDFCTRRGSKYCEWV